MNDYKVYPCDVDACGECPFGFRHCADCRPLDINPADEEEDA